MTINNAVSNVLITSKECKTCEPTVIKHSSMAPIPLPDLYRSRSFLLTSTLLGMAGLGIYELNSVGSQEHFTIGVMTITNMGLIAILSNVMRRLQKSHHDLDQMTQRCQDALRLVDVCAVEEDNQLSQTLTVQDLYNNAPCGYHSLSPDGIVMLINDTELKMLGYDRAEVVGKMSFLEFVAPESQLKWIEKFQVLKAKGIVKDVEILLKNRNGEVFPVLANSTAITDKCGNYLSSRSTLIDIRKRKKVELALQKSEAQYRGIVEDQMDLICRFSPDGRLTFVNKAYCEYFNLDPERLLGKCFTPMVFEDDRAKVKAQFQSPSPHFPVTTIEHRAISASGQIGWQSWTNRAIFDESGTIVEYQSVGRDISDRKRQDAAVIKLTKALELAVVGIAEVNYLGRFVQVNDAYAEMSGYDNAELIGREWWQLIITEDRSKAIRAYQTMMDVDRAEVEIRSVRKNGQIFDRKIVLVKAYDENQQFVGHYSFTQDISSCREVDRLKDEFVSVVSHELRTPLTSIAGALDIVSSGILQTRPQQAHRMVTIAAQNTERLVRMVNDILDMERIKSGKITMEREQCDLAIILQESVEVMQMLADTAQVELKLNTDSVSVLVDRDRMIQVITNLLSNAIKFSEPHTIIDVATSLIDPSSSNHPVTFQLDKPSVLVSIDDRGRGIPHDKLATIFEPFQQVDASDSRQKGGTGLGLSICRSILHQHNAPLWVESNLGEGSTFYFALPRLLISSTTSV
jgi:PAS domain S-box-containing protein